MMMMLGRIIMVIGTGGPGLCAGCHVNRLSTWDPRHHYSRLTKSQGLPEEALGNDQLTVRVTKPLPGLVPDSRPPG